MNSNISMRYPYVSPFVYMVCLCFPLAYSKCFPSFTTETLDPEVKILCLSIITPDRPDIVLEIPENGKPKGLWFTLKEGSRHNLKFSFQVSNNIVSGLKYTNTVWKTGVKGK